MLAPIESSTDLILALGSHLAAIRNLDPLARSREETRKYRRRLLRAYGQRCGYCLRAYSPDNLEIAHIIPLEIGGLTTEDNLIVLCKSCHGSFDSGKCSIKLMTTIAAAWREEVPLSGQRPPLEMNQMTAASIHAGGLSGNVLDEVTRLQPMRRYVKAINLINNRLLEKATTPDSSIFLMIKRAELTRRRAARGAVGRAFAMLKEIETAALGSEARALFLYEFGYVNCLLGLHAKGSELMRQSAEAALRQTGAESVEYVAARVMEITCNIAVIDRLDENQASIFEGQFDDLRKTCLSSNSYWSGRWSLNCQCNMLQVRVKVNDSISSWTRLEQLRDLYFDCDVSNGWDVAARQRATQLEGVVRVLFCRNHNDLSSGVGLLARAFMTRLGRRQRLEGIRDVGLTLSTGLRALGDSRTIHLPDMLEALMLRTMDGTSFVSPWRAAN
jgi:hypothetical protein